MFYLGHSLFDHAGLVPDPTKKDYQEWRKERGLARGRSRSRSALLSLPKEGGSKRNSSSRLAAKRAAACITRQLGDTGDEGDDEVGPAGPSSAAGHHKPGRLENQMHIFLNC